MVKFDEVRLKNFRDHFGKLVCNCKAFNDMIEIMLKLEDKRLLYYIIEKFWFIEQQRCHYWKNLPKSVKSYYRPFFRKNMQNVMRNAISRCGNMDCTTKMKGENGERLFADKCELAYQFNKSNCHTIIMNVLSTYFKVTCKV